MLKVGALRKEECPAAASKNTNFPGSCTQMKAHLEYDVTIKPDSPILWIICLNEYCFLMCLTHLGHNFLGAIFQTIFLEHK